MYDYGLTSAQMHCDNAEPPRYNRKPVCYCDNCGSEIYVGEQFLRLDEINHICMDCVWFNTDIAEEEEEYE